MRIIVCLLCLLYVRSANATVKPNSLFSDNVVLQRNMPVPVWGTASEGEKITVTIGQQRLETVAQNGKWLVKLAPMKAGGPFTMIIKGENEVVIKNILIGEVWICSGQSNMERQLGPRGGQKLINNWENERDSALYPEIREFHVPRKGSDVPVEDAGSKWVVCSPATVAEFSAVGYFFARDLYKQLKVPIGILFSSVGGTPAEHWTPQATLQSTAAFSEVLAEHHRKIEQYPATLEKYRTEEAGLLEKYRADSAKASQASNPLPRKPSRPSNAANSGAAGGLYNGMIHPLKPFAIRGVTWYQGESNRDNPDFYQSLFPAMINGWRTEWKQGDFPFLFVQVAPYHAMPPTIREAQLMALSKASNTAMVVTTDCGDSADIHPTWKQPVGARLALAARALAYNEKLEYSGPLFQSMKLKGNQAVLSFSHAKSLVAKDGELQGFTIAGSDGRFVPATAVIKGTTVLVSAPGIPQPAAVRYGWSNVPHVNLFNEAGLPASPFRTDKP
ncbi:sialate O-acetylesterase [Filimonas effusa]|uniref:9-O-acetylesterase n=1 Tax=Filimonas effusa TaxID=2508721 RepID=A0A4Q1D9P8_9BACT|nr:sialate O-acetylesterase [Filimonas effusa]RXK85578.1 9-O-acetylesterase [Filimonas effusa]